MITTLNHNIFYSGDTGYLDGFKKIGAALEPFNLAILENGAYDKARPTVHMMPLQTIQAYKDLKADVLLAARNNTKKKASDYTLLVPYFEKLVAGNVDRISSLPSILHKHLKQQHQSRSHLSISDG